MIICTVVCLVSAFSWFNKPFAGFLLYDFPYVGSYGSKEWPGAKAGLKFLERIVAVDGQAVLQGRDVVAFMKDKQPGDTVNYVVESRGQERKMSIPVTRFGIKDFFQIFVIPFLGGLALYTLGFIVYVLKPDTSASWVFLFLCFCVGSYMITGFEILTSYFFVHFHWIIIPLFPATFFHLGLVFPDKKRILSRFPWFEYIIYVPALILVVAYQIYLFSFQEMISSGAHSWMPSHREIAKVYRWYALFCAVSLIVMVLHAMFKASSSSARQRARMVLFGVTIAFLPCGVIMLLSVIFGIEFPWNFLVFFCDFLSCFHCLLHCQTQSL
jgi:hypothetical protein